MSFEVDGKLHKVFDTESKTQTFQAREFVIEIGEGQYPQYIKFQLTQDRCGLIENYEVGSMIKVYFDLRGREWNEKYFTNLNAWRIANAEGNNTAPPSPDASAENNSSAGGDAPNFDSFPKANDELQLDIADDDLPF